MKKGQAVVGFTDDGGDVSEGTLEEFGPCVVLGNGGFVGDVDGHGLGWGGEQWMGVEVGLRKRRRERTRERER